MNTELSIENLKYLELHDQGLENFSINFSSKEIKMKIEVYNELDNNYDASDILFTNVSNINFVNFETDDFDSVEINSHEIEATKDNRYKIKFIILFGFGKGSADINFEFSSCYMIPLGKVFY